MFNIFKKLRINKKSNNLMYNVLEPILGQNKDYAYGILRANNFSLNADTNSNATIGLLSQDLQPFIRKDTFENVHIGLKFNENDICEYYLALLQKPGQPMSQSLALDSESVRKEGFIKD